MKWFRFYSEALDDAKVQCLPIALRWHWVEILCLASVAEPRGRLRADVALAYRLRLRNARLTSVIRELVHVGLLDEVDGYVVPHGWDKRQRASDDVAERVRNHRARNVTETAPDTDVDKQIQKQKEIQIVPPPSEAGEIFRAYEDAFGRAVPNAVVAQQLIEAERDYGRGCVVHCLEDAALADVRDWRYAKRIMERHAKEGCNDDEDQDFERQVREYNDRRASPLSL